MIQLNQPPCDSPTFRNLHVRREHKTWRGSTWMGCLGSWAQNDLASGHDSCAALDTVLHELYLRRCARRRRNGETGYAGSKMRWRGVRHGDALQTNESFAMRRQDWKSFTSTSCTPKAKKTQLGKRKNAFISRGTGISIMSVHDIFRVGVI